MKLKNILLYSVASLLLAGCSKSNTSKMDIFIGQLMDEMTVKEKIGQLNLNVSGGFVAGEGINGNTVPLEQRIENGEIGGLFGLKNVEVIKHWQQAAVEKSRLHIPLLFGMDVVHGYDVTFPIPLALASSWNPDMIEQVARTSAIEASSDGVNWVFSPMVDVCHDARWGRIAESAGEDPYLGGEIAKAWVRGYQTNNLLDAPDNVMACVKHYALYGAGEAGRDYNTVNLGRQEILNSYMRPYAEAAKVGAASYMSSFNEFEGIPATANKYLLTDLLRDTYGFNGFVVSDATAVIEEVAHGIGDLQEVSARSLQAGLDMDMNSDGFIGTLKKSLDEGRVTRADIDKACRRILEAKYKLGLFENPYKYLNPDRAAKEVFTAENRAFARQVAQECQVLLKNNGVLPLKKDARIVVIGPLADNASEMSGTWSMSNHADENVTILQGIKDAVNNPNNVSYAEGSWFLNDAQLESDLKYGLIGLFMPDFKPEPVHTTPKATLLTEALAKARQADVVVACVGENSMMNGEGASRADISIPDAQLELLKALKTTGKPVVLVLNTGRPLTLTWEDENMDAILNTWSQGSEAGHAIADVLFGDVNPSAKLTTSFPRAVGQLPLYYNHKNTGRPHGDEEKYIKFRSNYIDVVNAPLYPFGYGLSYTTYEYSDVTLSAPEVVNGGKFTATVTVKNTGNMDGKEIVQLYIHDVVSTSTRPVKELRGFQKIDIKAGETKTVIFELSTEDLKYYNHELEYVCEPGDFEIMIGPNSRDTKTAVLTVK